MNKFLSTLIFFALLAATNLNAATNDTTKIIFQNNMDVDCWSGIHTYDNWQNIQNGSKQFKKVLLRVDMGCASYGCCSWDYTYHTFLEKHTGIIDSVFDHYDTLSHTPLTLDTVYRKFERLLEYELGRSITPYSSMMRNSQNGYTPNWKHPYYFDVTDYLPLLQDSVDLRINAGGWDNTGHYGFSATNTLIFIEGVPNRTVKAITTLYDKEYRYINFTQFDTITPTQTNPTPADVTAAKVIGIITGHGAQGEFTPRSYSLDVNGNTVYTHLLWNDQCGSNPIQPQNGTWVYNRCNWCPGGIVPINEVDITPYITPGHSDAINYSMENFTTNPGDDYRYISYLSLITYKTNTQHDLAISDVLAPSNDPRYSRVLNPTATNPIIRLKNEGLQVATRANIDYWVNDSFKCTYTWTGSLDPWQTVDVTLPIIKWGKLNATNNMFHATLQHNGSNTDYFGNDTIYSLFNTPPVVVDSQAYIWFKSNNHPEQDMYFLINERGDTLVNRNNMAANTQYRDTFNLTAGSYRFELWDYWASIGGGDGIGWAYNSNTPAETGGNLQFRRLGSNIAFKTFALDFGNVLRYQFTISDTLGSFAGMSTCTTTEIKPLENKIGLNLYPNPTSGKLLMDIQLGSQQNMNVSIYDLIGNKIAERNYSEFLRGNLDFDLSNAANGVYFVKLQAGQYSTTKKVVLQR